MTEPGLPDLDALTRHLEQTMRVGATLRGVEAVITGRLSRRGDAMFLEIAGTPQTIRLTPLRHKVQWDVAAKREQAVTRAEKDAYTNLLAQGNTGTVRITGPLTPVEGETALTLEVRAFAPVIDPHPKEDRRP